jgi:hypothetical protein
MVIISLFCTNFITAQVTYSGNVDLTSQADVDAFTENTAYTYIDGNLYINTSSSDITNLHALASLDSVSGDVEISRQGALVDLQGLHNLKKVNSLYLYALYITDLSQLGSLLSVNNYLRISRLHSLISLDGFNANIEIGNELIIGHADNSYFGNDELRDFCALSSQIIEHMQNGTCTFGNNFYNPTLQNFLDGNCEPIIYDWIYYDDITFQNQTMIDTFYTADHPYTYIEGNVVISTGVSSLDGLNMLDSTLDFRIANSNVTNLAGLGNLKKTDQCVISCDMITDLDDLSSLQTVNATFEITNCDNIQTLDLSNFNVLNLTLQYNDLLTTVDFNNSTISNSIRFYNNDALTTIQNFSNTYLGTLEIIGSSDINSLSEFSSLQEVSMLQIQENNSLLSLDGLDNINSANIINIGTVQAGGDFGNDNLYDFCAISDLILSCTNVNIGYNLYNPTNAQLTSGDCSLDTYTLTFNFTDGTNPVQYINLNFDGTTYESNSNSQIVIENLVAGDYDFTVTHPSYLTETGTVSVSADETIDITMLGNFAVTLNIFNDYDNLAVEGATVTLNGNVVTSNEFGVAEMGNFQNGTYNLTVTAPGFQNYASQITVNNAPINSDVRILPDVTYYDINFTVYHETNLVENAQINIAGQTITTSASGTESIDELEAGVYPFTVEAEYFATYTGSVTIVDENINHEIYLSLEQYAVLFTISDGLNPIEGANLNINGIDYTSPESGIIGVGGLVHDTYEYTVTAAGFQDLTDDIFVTESTELTIEMSEIVIQSHFVTTTITDGTNPIAGAEVTFDGTTLTTMGDGYLEFGEFENGTYDLSVTADGYENYTEQITVQDESLDLEITLTVTTSISENKITEKLNIYPNPVQNQVTIEGLSIGENISVIDIFGRVITKTQIDKQTMQLNVHNLNNGIYFINTGQTINKIVVEK